MNPPKRPIRFLRWFCREDCIDEIEGDLTEIFRKESGTSSRAANWKFALRVARYFRPEFIKPFRNSQLKPFGMYSSYFKVGWRNLIRNKGYSFINIGGLAIGMMVAILNGLWIWHEFSYNQYFTNYDRIAQVIERGVNFETGDRFLNTTMTYPLSLELMDKYRGQFTAITRMSQPQEQIVSVGDIMIMSQGIYVDDSAPEMFSFKMLQGSHRGLAQTQSIMISKSLATTLFGTGDPMDKTILLNNNREVKVTGVFEDFPQNTTFNEARLFLPWSLYLLDSPWVEKHATTDWRNHFLKIHVQLPEGRSLVEVAMQIGGALRFDPEDAEHAKKSKKALDLHPMSDWHLHPAWLPTGQFEPLVMIRLVGIIGAFVLVLACINFVNLSTARAEKRAKEVGIRKTIGSVRSQLVNQFFSESFLVVIFSFVIAILLTALLLPGFNELATKNLEMPWDNGWFWLSSACFVVLTSLLAGAYPAIYLSSFKPVRALKGTFRLGRLASLPRKVLVVFQFSISVVLIVGTVVVYQQIQFAKNRPVGYDREGLIMFPKKSEAFANKYEVFRNELKNTGMVYEVSESMGPVTEIYSGNGGWEWEGKDPTVHQGFGTLSVSHMHGKTVGWQFIMGRDFDMAIDSDSSGVVMNESALKVMGLSNPIGEPITWTWWQNKDLVLNYKILGVIRDMVMDSPYAPPRPTIFYIKGHNGNPSWINVKINPQVSASEALPKIESVFRKFAPAVPFNFKFADEEYARKFAKEERIGNLSFVFAGLAILISCLGLLGLASFVAETRTKEIGIRKVLGATVAGLWRMLSKDFIWLVLIACLVAGPAAYYLMTKWLQKFSYRTDISIWVFVGTGMAAVAVTLLTVSYQAVRAARANPTASLKSE